MSTTIQKDFHRNGQLFAAVPLRKGQRHGVCRTWHKNGVLASQEPYRDGLPHGVCRQWNEAGRLLGKYKMVHGTGTQKSWHDNGRLNQEFTTIAGEFSGRSRLWLRDGTLISDRVVLSGRPVTRAEYHRAMLKEPRLPKFRGWPAKLPPRNRAWHKHLQHVFVRGLLSKRNQSEARSWLKAGGKTRRLAGRFKRESDALKFVEELYSAGAVKVIVTEIYHNKNGDQFADNLLVQLPKATAARRAVRKVSQQLQRRRLGAVEPDQDLGEVYLLLSMP